jgi:hypothetical protein
MDHQIIGETGVLGYGGGQPNRSGGRRELPGSTDCTCCCRLCIFIAQFLLDHPVQNRELIAMRL